MRSPRRTSLTFAGALLALLTVVLCAARASARVGGESEYSKAQTHSGALRYLRGDMGYEVVERDPDAAYLIFRYELPGQKKATATGTIEDGGAAAHREWLVQIPTMRGPHRR